MEITYTPQHSYNELSYEIDHDNEVIKAATSTGETYARDLSWIPENYVEDDELGPAFPGFPIAGMPKRIDGVLHVTLIEWYR